jgi:arsenate reductase-like glutaredoxin family protein
MEENEKVAETVDSIKKNKSCSSRKTEVDLLEEQKLTPNNNNFIKNKINNNKINNIVNKEDLPVNNSLNKNIKISSEEEVIDKLTYEYLQKGLTKDVCKRVVEEVRQKKNISNFGGYLRNSLENTLNRSEIRRGIKDPAEKLKQISENQNVPFYNWLES